jgi:hypothetical protein
MTDADRLAAILATLPPADVAFLQAQFAAPWERRAARLAERDAAVRQAIAAHAALAPRPAAEALATELRRITATPHSQGSRTELLRRIVELSGNKPLAWRRILDIGTVTDVQKSNRTLHNRAAIEHA